MRRAGPVRRSPLLVFTATAARLRDGIGVPDLAAVEPALDDLEEFLTRLQVPIGQEDPQTRLSALLHQFDHLHRMTHRAQADRRLETLLADPSLARPAAALAEALRRAASAPDTPVHAARLERLHRLVKARTQRVREAALLREHAGLENPADVFALTDALRWLEHTASHAARIAQYGVVAAMERPASPAAARTREIGD